MVVNCLADGVQVDITVGNPGFNGVMYVKGYSKNEECRRVVKQDVDVGTVDFKVNFNTCGLIHENVSGEYLFENIIVLFWSLGHKNPALCSSCNDKCS